MNKRITADDFHNAVERQLSGLEPDPWLAQRIIASEREEIKVKKVSGAMLIIIAVIILATATALAVGLGGRVNWLGEILPESDVTVAPTPMPTAEPQAAGDPDEIDPRFYELLDYAKDREMIVLDTAHNGAWSGRTQKIGTMEDFKALMDTAAPDFPFPGEIPEGYVFDRCAVEFGCLPQGEYTLTSQTIHPEGFTESHYSVDPAMDFVKAYDLVFRAVDDSDYISIHAYMNWSVNPGEYAFRINEGQNARAVRVEGMENALIIDSDSIRHLAMRKIMSSSQEYLQFTGPGINPVTETYDEYRIEARTRLLPESELIGMFER